MRSKKINRNGAQEHVLRTLSEFSPMSHRDYAEFAGISPSSAFERLRDLWDSKVLHIEGYERGVAGRAAPLYAIGFAIDEERPKALTDAEKCARYQATPKGKKSIKKHHKRAKVKHKKRMETNPAYAEAHRAKCREWARKKHGCAPREFRKTNLLDEIAMQFGITWRFEKTRRKAA